MDTHKQHTEDEQQFTGKWETSLVRCFPCGPFWKAIACPCIFYGETAQRLRDPTVPAEKDNDDCMDFARDNVLFSSCFLQIMEHRAEIRRRYGIKGSSTNDCLVSCFCCSCAVMQHDDELKARLASQGIGIKEAYKSEEPMMMAAPGQGQPGPQPQWQGQGQPQWQGQGQPQWQGQGQPQWQGQEQSQAQWHGQGIPGAGPQGAPRA